MGDIPYGVASASKSSKKYSAGEKVTPVVKKDPVVAKTHQNAAERPAQNQQTDTSKNGSAEPVVFYAGDNPDLKLQKIDKLTQ